MLPDAAMVLFDPAVSSLVDDLPRCWLFVLRGMAATTILLGSAIFLWNGYTVSLLTLVGQSGIVYHHFSAGGANSSSEVGVTCETLFCIVDENDTAGGGNNNEDNDTSSTGDTWDSETDEADEWQLIRRPAMPRSNNSNNNNNTYHNTTRLRPRPNVVVTFTSTTTTSTGEATVGAMATRPRNDDNGDEL